MKYFNLLLFLVVFSLPATVFAQSAEDAAYTLLFNDAAHPCISAQEYADLEKHCAENLQLLGLPVITERAVATTSLSWPLRLANGVNDCSYYAITAYVDQNTTAGAVQDWNCGSNTYDSHRGTDIAAFPYPFYKLDNNEVEVIAAAAGTILYKSDGHFDKYCAANSDTANYIVIRHADGSQANYFHLKKNSLTAKTVGQTVAAGEYLGVVGSSGNSSGPHLHFEVWSGSTVSTLNDPFSGNCNLLNGSSWWASQKPYTEPAAIKVSVNTTDAVFPACPATETPNESDVFAVPFQGVGLAPGYAKFYLFMRNETSGNVANLSILNPNNSVFNSWTYTSTTTSKTGTRSFSKLLPTTPGTYTFKATYNGTECTTAFTITSATGIVSTENEKPAIALQPNPAAGNVVIAVAENLVGSTYSICDVTGNKISEGILQTNHQQLSTEKLFPGIYLVTVQSNVVKLIVE